MAPAVLIFIGLIPLAMVALGKYLKLTNNVKAVLVVFGLGLVVFGVAMGTGVMDMLGGDDTNQVVEDEYIYEVTASEAMSHITYDSDARKFTWAVSFNDTADTFVSNTEYMLVNFTIARADLVDEDSITSCILGTVGSVDVVGASDEYLVDENTDDTFKVKFTKDNGQYAYESCNVKVEGGSSNYVLMNITLNADALANMDQYDSGVVVITIAGFEFEVTILKATVSA